MNRALTSFALAGAWLVTSACTHAAAPVVRADPTRAPSAAALQARGLAALRAGDGVRAEQYLSLAVRAGAPESSVIGPLVTACAAASRLQSALGYALPYLSAHPDDWRLRLLVAAIQLALGRDELAQDQLARVRREQPHAADAHYLLGVIARDEHDDAAGASAAFVAYLRERPSGPHAAEARAFLREHAPDAPTAEPNATGAEP